METFGIRLNSRPDINTGTVTENSESVCLKFSLLKLAFDTPSNPSREELKYAAAALAISPAEGVVMQFEFKERPKEDKGAICIMKTDTARPNELTASMVNAASSAFDARSLEVALDPSVDPANITSLRIAFIEIKTQQVDPALAAGALTLTPDALSLVAAKNVSISSNRRAVVFDLPRIEWRQSIHTMQSEVINPVRESVQPITTVLTCGNPIEGSDFAAKYRELGPCEFPTLAAAVNRAQDLIHPGESILFLAPEFAFPKSFFLNPGPSVGAHSSKIFVISRVLNTSQVTIAGAGIFSIPFQRFLAGFMASDKNAGELKRAVKGVQEDAADFNDRRMSEAVRALNN